MVAATSGQDICFNCAALPASQQITVPNPTEVPASHSSICLRGGGAGGGQILPPSGGPTQVRTTPGLKFRAVIGLEGEVCLDVVL
jgi:hypothetical protein